MRHFLITAMLGLSAISARAEMGFLKLAEAPESIQKVAPSVIQVFMPEGRIVRRYDRADYETPEFKNELETLKNVHLKSQMRFCATRQLEFCLVYDGFAISTGFVVKDSHHVVTNRHVAWNNLRDLIAEYVKRGDSYAAAFEKAAKRPFVIKIAKNLKRIPTNTRQIEALVWYENEGLNSLAKFDHPDFPAFMGSDIMVVKIQEDLGVPPLRFAHQSPASGQKIFILGYPAATSDRRQNHGKGEARGLREISVSQGQRLTIEESLQRLSLMNSRIGSAYNKVKSDPAYANAWRENVLFTDADSDVGSSGSPVVNEQGEVVAIQSARLIEYRGSQPGLTITFAIPMVGSFVETSPLRLVPH